MIPPAARFGARMYEREWREDLLPRYVAAVDRAEERVDKADASELMALIDEYLSAQPRAEALQRLDKIKHAGFDPIKFAWMGGLEKGGRHYYRVQGGTFLIEYDNTQNNANHIHCVWRDFNGDWGEDLLAEHYRNSPHHQHAMNAH